jgi:hypothetical protein
MQKTLQNKATSSKETMYDFKSYRANNLEPNLYLAEHLMFLTAFVCTPYLTKEAVALEGSLLR